MKRFLALILVFVLGAFLVSCEDDGWKVDEVFTYKDISNWVGMVTPDAGAAGSVVETDDDEGFVSIKGGESGWGGIQSGEITLDLKRDPLIFIRIFENNDPFKWGMKFLPNDSSEEHEWGIYLFEDNNFKHKKYAVVDVNDQIGEALEEYGDKVTGVLWVFSAGHEDATVEVMEIKIVYQK